MWRFRGTPHYLKDQARRLGLSQLLADSARNNKEIYRVSVLLAQLCGRYHAARTEHGKPVFPPVELAEIKGTLAQCELELEKLHALAGSAQAMLDEAWGAFGVKPPDRPFEIFCNYDQIAQPILPLGDGTVGVVASCEL
jgi:hypothetical protein